MCPRAKTTVKRNGARKPRERTMVPGFEGTCGVVTRRRSFWLAVSGSGRRVAFHEAAGSRHRLRESTVFCVHSFTLQFITSTHVFRSKVRWHVVNEAFLFDIEEVEHRYRRRNERRRRRQPTSDKSPAATSLFH